MTIKLQPIETAPLDKPCVIYYTIGSTICCSLVYEKSDLLFMVTNAIGWHELPEGVNNEQS